MNWIQSKRTIMAMSGDIRSDVTGRVPANGIQLRLQPRSAGGPAASAVTVVVAVDRRTDHINDYKI